MKTTRATARVRLTWHSLNLAGQLCSEHHDVRLLELQLGGVLGGDDALVGLDVARSGS